ncbi:MAG: hypothetical protein HOV87_20975 [Catenulispora sp.]|nr:hypothetical protein [Catenulispora sp.]
MPIPQRARRTARHRLRAGVGLALATVTSVGALSGPAQAARPAPAKAAPTPSAPAAAPSRLASPQSVLAAGWQTSPDRAVTTSGDGGGFHVLVADAASGYQWRTAATLSEPGFDTDQWIGQSCVTASGRRAVVVYAPRSFTNLGEVFDAGAFVATVDLATGAVHKLPFTGSLAYYDPGCGTGEQATISSLSTQGGKAVSTVRLIDAATGAVVRKTDSPGQLSSPVPYNGGVAAALGSSIVSIDASGNAQKLATEAGVPYRIHPDAAGGLAYQVPAGKQTEVHRFAQGRSALLGTGAAGAVQIAASGGQVYLIGPDAAKIPAAAAARSGWHPLAAPADAEPSTTGALVVTGATNHVTAAEAGTPAGTLPTRIAIKAAVTGTGKQVSFALDPKAADPAAGRAASPALAQLRMQFGAAPTDQGTKTTAAGRAVTPNATTLGSSSDPSTVPWDPERGCAVPRNDPSIQTYQPTASQVEWAADLAVQGQLTRTRGVNWQNSGMTVSWSPQGMFPLQAVNGGGRLPVQVLLGVLAQESNTLQASPHAVDAVNGNFNQGGFYGDGIDWGTVDCGYGIGQITTGMAKNTPAGTPIADGNMAYTTAQQQQAIATDYGSNIAATANMLIDKWNQLKALGITAGNGDPAKVENWWFAVWAYNSGVQPGSAAYGNTTGCAPGPNCTDNGGAGGNWGLGWLNNPANPIYPADRGVFTNDTAKTKVPNHWTYPEKVMGWAYSPVPRYNYATGQWNQAFSPAMGPTSPAEPGFMQFCVPGTDANHGDNCTPNAAADSKGTANTAGLCDAAQSHCWWHYPSSWTDCSQNCGTARVMFNSGSTPPLATNVYPPDCRGMGTVAPASSSDSYGFTPPSGTIVVGNTSVPQSGCDVTGTEKGSFGLKFTYASPYCNPGCTLPIDYPGKKDFHQLGAGYGGHIWFTHTVAKSDTADTIVGTWTPPALNGWVRVYAHIPDSGDTTQQAPYTITTGLTSKTRYVNTLANKNEWVSLGVFQFDSTGAQNVSLTNATYDGDGTMDIAWDAVGFQPLASKPADFVVQMGDSYSSGEGATSYLPGTDHGPYAQQKTDSSPGETWNACRRSTNSWIRKTTLPTQSRSIGAESDVFDTNLDFHSTACSGALTTEVLGDPAQDTKWGYDGQFHEVEQLASGYLDENTTLVTLTLGGNDAGFADAVQGCAQVSCPDDTAQKAKINEAVNRVSDVIQAIHAKAPKARVVLLGYPELFDKDDHLLCTNTIMLPPAMTQLNAWGDYFTTLDAAMVDTLQRRGVPVTFVDATPFFAGHTVCGNSPGINDVVKAPNGPGDYFVDGPFDWQDWILVSRSSFHPNSVGTDQYALALKSAL